MCGIIRCKAACGDVTGAREDAKSILSKKPNARGVHLEYARILEQQGYLEEARSQCLKGSLLEDPWDSFHVQKNTSHAERLLDQINRRDELRMLEDEFLRTWGEILEYTKTEEFSEAPKTWSIIQIRFELSGGDESDDEEGELKAHTASRLLRATEAAARKTGQDDDVTENDDEVELNADGIEDVVIEENVVPVTNPSAYGSIKLTKEVLKWLKEADSKFKELFIKKIEKLAQGDWGFTTAKLLKGSNTKIYETYLEQKSGNSEMTDFRINFQNVGCYTDRLSGCTPCRCCSSTCTLHLNKMAFYYSPFCLVSATSSS